MSEYNNKPVRVNWGIGIGLVGDQEGYWEFNPGELPIDPDERESFLDQCLDTEISNYLDSWYKVVEDD